MSFIDVEIKGLAEMKHSFLTLSRLNAEDLGLVRALTIAAEGIMRDSRRLVPVDWGTLRGSGVVEPAIIAQDEVEVGMAYGGAAKKYARSVHENPRSGKTGGRSPTTLRYGIKSRKKVYSQKYKRYATTGQWKFLEQPFLAARERVLEIIAEVVNRRIEEL